jgi:hypothetical protein
MKRTRSVCVTPRSIRKELESPLESLAVDDERDLIAKARLLGLYTHACTLDAPSGGRAERTRLPIHNAFAREVMCLF